MKILIGYDGSECADAALDDLMQAGLPANVEAYILSVAEVWLPPPPPSSYDMIANTVSSVTSSPMNSGRRPLNGSCRPCEPEGVPDRPGGCGSDAPRGVPAGDGRW